MAKRVRRTKKVAATWIDERGYEVGPCVAPGCHNTECSTHPDAYAPLDFCGDCGGVTCHDHRTHESHG